MTAQAIAYRHAWHIAVHGQGVIGTTWDNINAVRTPAKWDNINAVRTPAMKPRFYKVKLAMC